MITFSQALKRHIADGMTAPRAMKLAWAGVRAGGVARPPRRRRNPLSNQVIGAVDVTTPVGSKEFALGRPIQRVAVSVNPTRGFTVQRVASPRAFDPQSFRTVTTRSGARITVGCPKGKYSRRARRCKVGTLAQRIMRPKAANPGRVSARALLGACLAYLEDLKHSPLTRAAVPDEQWLRPIRRYLARNPLTERETKRVLKAARDSFRLGRRRTPPALTAPEAHDPTARAAARAYHFGEGDAFAGVARTFGVRRGRPRAIARKVYHSFRHALQKNPGVVIYDRLLEIRAQKGAHGHFPGERFVHRFKPGSQVLGLPNGDLLIRPRRRA